MILLWIIFLKCSFGCRFLHFKNVLFKRLLIYGLNNQSIDNQFIKYYLPFDGELDQQFFMEDCYELLKNFFMTFLYLIMTSKDMKKTIKLKYFLNYQLTFNQINKYSITNFALELITMIFENDQLKNEGNWSWRK